MFLLRSVCACVCVGGGVCLFGAKGDVEYDQTTSTTSWSNSIVGFIVCVWVGGGRGSTLVIRRDTLPHNNTIENTFGGLNYLYLPLPTTPLAPLTSNYTRMPPTR